MNSQVDQPCIASFRDESARTWEVREIRNPVLSERRGFFQRAEFADGWLLFMSGTERRRLAPFPSGWHLASEKQLRQWCSDAMAAKLPTE
jgi:hypothetical protein